MRRMAHFTGLMLRSVIRKTVWPALLMVGVITVISSYLKVYPNEPALAVHMTAYGQLLLTITFMMLGMHFSSEARHVSLDDVIAAYTKKNNYLLRSQLLALLALDFFITLAIVCAICFSTLTGGSAVWARQVAAHVVLLYFLPCYALGVWGMLIAQWNRGRSVFFPAILVWLATSSLAIDFNSYFDTLGFASGRMLQTMFNMGVSNMRDIQGAVMTPPIERPWWVARAVISVFLTALLLGGSARKRAIVPGEKRNKTLIQCFIVLGAIAAIVFLGMRFTVFFSRFADPAIRTEYAQAKANMYIPGQSVSLADYPGEKNIQLLKTDIDLSCTSSGIQASVRIEALMNTGASGQAFTLYSDLVVDEVLVDGEPAVFVRSHDGLMVHFSKSRSLGESVVFNFIYHGYSLPLFPANETTVQLNRAYPWIPWPGIKKASDYQNFFDYSKSEDFFIENWQRGDEVEYILHYKGPGDLYTNLAHQEGALYKGTSASGVSLYSGMSHQTVRGVDVYMPASQHEYALPAASALMESYAATKELCEKMGAYLLPKMPKSIIVIEMGSPVILRFPSPYPSELSAWGDEWEIRQTSTSGTIIERRRYGDDLQGYQASRYARVYIPITYLLAPSCGYPVNVPHSATINFSSWLSFYLSVSDDAKEQDQTFADETDNDFGVVGTIDFYDFVRGAPVPGTPISEEESAQRHDILCRMTSGENFDESFRLLYQRLLNEEMITASEMILILYNNQGG